jgi:hypothetical protein
MRRSTRERLVADALDALEEVQQASDWLRQKALKRITVHTEAGQSFEGLVEKVTDDGIVLRAAKLLAGAATEKDIELAGETWVPRSQIIFGEDHA